MNLAARRRAIRPLLNERIPADAAEVYYAFYHGGNKTQLILSPPSSAETTMSANGYLAISRTGIDLFRPLLTMRLPEDHQEVAALFATALPPGANVFINAPAGYEPLLKAFFDVQTEQTLRLLRLDAGSFRPVINVLVVRTDTPDGLPRYVVRPTNPEAGDEIGAWATVNWQSPHFADVAVGTRPAYRQRGWGRSVVSALSQHLLETGRLPLYEVEEHNSASQMLARNLGFKDTGHQRVFMEAVFRAVA
jgi:ribosomal protein S18 acetylase RimI-like enzyme